MGKGVGSLFQVGVEPGLVRGLTRLCVGEGGGGGDSLVELACFIALSCSHQLLLRHFLCDFVPYNC